MEEGEDVFGSHAAGGFEFTAFLAKEELAIGVEDGDRRNATVERDVIPFGDVEILVHLADVDVDDDEGFVEGGSDFGRMKGFIEDVAIETPVAAEDHQDAFVGSGGGVNGFGDFGIGVGGSRIDLPVVERLAKARGVGPLLDGEKPLSAFLSPPLEHGDEFFARSDAGFKGECELDYEDMEIGSGIFPGSDVGGEVGEALGFEARPEGEFVL